MENFVMYMFVLSSCQTHITVHLSTHNFYSPQSKKYLTTAGDKRQPTDVDGLESV